MPALLGHSPFGITKPPAGSRIDWGHPLSKGLVGLWALNERGGNTTQDLVASDIATFQASPSWANGGVLINGTTNFLRQNYSPRFNCFNGLSMEAIFSTTTTSGNQTIIGKPFASTHTTPFFDYVMLILSGSINFRMGSTTVTNVAIATGITHHIVLTADGITMRWYRNGAQQATNASATLPTNTNSQGIEIGGRAGPGELLFGTIYKAAVYTRALSQPEVQQLYNEPFAMLRGPDPYRRTFAMAGKL